eukprot:CAMPEP_0170370686 /NCGR_PEP_ID=MMETSP0117_2-20130122/8639_1 /TAXON_ID=400756 /ORGANISM="Durinskia baltica, Strain CSIRO CS-38" /LENGTH=380 /DNA_ID=CAMNT_0010625469 /DNA_START=41 /DNA_END=1179 /DNA_ORIENTATION=-
MAKKQSSLDAVEIRPGYLKAERPGREAAEAPPPGAHAGAVGPPSRAAPSCSRGAGLAHPELERGELPAGGEPCELPATGVEDRDLAAHPDDAREGRAVRRKRRGRRGLDLDRARREALGKGPDEGAIGAVRDQHLPAIGRKLPPRLARRAERQARGILRVAAHDLPHVAADLQAERGVRHDAVVFVWLAGDFAAASALAPGKNARGLPGAMADDHTRGVEPGSQPSASPQCTSMANSSPAEENATTQLRQARRGILSCDHGPPIGGRRHNVMASHPAGSATGGHVSTCPRGDTMGWRTLGMLNEATPERTSNKIVVLVEAHQSNSVSLSGRNLALWKAGWPQHAGSVYLPKTSTTDLSMKPGVAMVTSQTSKESPKLSEA